jgi:hypothetical protein
MTKAGNPALRVSPSAAARTVAIGTLCLGVALAHPADALPNKGADAAELSAMGIGCLPGFFIKAFALAFSITTRLARPASTVARYRRSPPSVPDLARAALTKKAHGVPFGRR